MSLVAAVLGLGSKAVGVVTGPGRLYAEFAVVGVLLAGVGGQTWRLHSEQAKSAKAELATQQVLTKWNAQVAEGTRVAFVASEAERAKEASREAARKENVDEAQRMAARGRADLVVADGAHARLLQRAAATAGAAGRGEGSRDPVAAQGGPTASGAGLLLADVLGRADARAGLLAGYADEARTAGLACERAYDSLNSKGTP